MTPNIIGKTGALFIIALMLSIPFYSASVYAASLSITANSGQAGISNYLDGDGDVWRVEATIANAGSAVDPTKVQLKVGENSKAFNSCSEGALGAVCELLSPLTNGVAERETTFKVEYQFVDEAGSDTVASDSDIIRADGTAPLVTISNVRQAEGKVTANIKVDESVNQGAPFVGIQQIDILDAMTGALLDSQADFPPPKELFEEQVQLVFSGEGVRQIKVRAVDRLGHEKTAVSSVFSVDFVKPDIKIETLNFATLGEFIGEVIGRSDITVDIIESSDLSADQAGVVAFSEQASLQGQKAQCDPDEEQEILWHCTWEEVEVQPLEAVTVRIVVKDEFGNQAEESVTKNFVKDVSAPTADFFGTRRLFAGRSYVKSGENEVILQAQDQGADLSIAGIRANLGALGGGQFDVPDKCEATESTFNCVWETSKTFSSDGIVRIGLSKFQDRVGNQGEAGEVELVVDTAGPKVLNMSVFGVSDIGDKRYFQSNDQLKLDFFVSESSGLTILANLDGVVMDAKNMYTESKLTLGLGDGWRAFTEQDCEQVSESVWHCVIETEDLKSGPADDVRLELRVRDTAGNEATAWPEAVENAEFGGETSQGVVIFDLLGLSLEDNPDYWEVDKVKSQVPFVDLDTTELTSARVAYEVTLQSSSAAKINSLDLLGCENDGSIALGRQVVWNNQFVEGQASPVKFTLMVEFPPFNGKELFANKIRFLCFRLADSTYNCLLCVFSVSPVPTTVCCSRYPAQRDG